MPVSTSISPKRRQSSRKLNCQVILLDNTEFNATFERKSAKGRELFDKVCEHLKLEDRDYFGLQYTAWEDGELDWMKMAEEIRSQRSKPYHFQFAVKYFPRNPRKVGQIARELLCLQVKDLLLRGKFLIPLPVKQHTILDGLFAQLWLGDYDSKIHRKGYIQEKLDRLFVAPCGINSDEEIIEVKYEALVHYNHRQHQGMNREEASVAFLESAQDLKLYGIALHKGATDKNANRVLLGLYEKGILVYEINECNEPGALVLEITWHEIVTTHNQNRKFHVLFYNDVKKDGGTFCYRFHGHHGNKAAERMHKASLEHKAFFYHPEKKHNRRSRSFAEADSIVRDSVVDVFDRADSKYATTGRDVKRGKNSFRRFKTSLRKKLPARKRKEIPTLKKTDDAEEAGSRKVISYV
jgi:erythrocyte membrane protein band 4.1